MSKDNYRDYNAEILEEHKKKVIRHIVIGMFILGLICLALFFYDYNTSKDFKQPILTESKYISLEILEKGKTENGVYYEIIRDTKTNILYLKYDNGLTPILNEAGKPKRFYETQVDIIDMDGNVTSTKEERQAYVVK